MIRLKDTQELREIAKKHNIPSAYIMGCEILKGFADAGAFVGAEEGDLVGLKLSEAIHEDTPIKVLSDVLRRVLGTDILTDTDAICGCEIEGDGNCPHCHLANIEDETEENWDFANGYSNGEKQTGYEFCPNCGYKQNK